MQPNKLYVGWDAKRDDGILFIYLFIYLSFNCFGFSCVRVKTGDTNSQIRKKTFLRSVEWGGLLSVTSLEQCNISQVKLKETGLGEMRDYFSLEFGSTVLPRSCVLFPSASNVYCRDSSQLFFSSFYIFVSVFVPWSPPLLPTPLDAATLSLPPGRRHQNAWGFAAVQN